MRELTGIGVGLAAAAGRVARMGEPLPAPQAAPSTLPPGEESARAAAALAEVAHELRRRGAVAGGEAQEVLEAQALMAADPGLIDVITARTITGRTAERALYEAFGEFRTLLAGAGDYLAARVADLDDVRDRTIAACSGLPMPGVPDPDHPFVLVARDLAPADTALLDLAKVLALVTSEGGPTSHTAILARARGIPAVVGCGGANDLADGEEVVVDAARGVVTAEPPAELLAQVRLRAQARDREGVKAPAAPGGTADGVPVALLANVGGPYDVPEAVAAGAEGIGLFRTEFLYLDAAEPPSLDLQVAAYRAVLDGFSGGTVVVRTLDVGADKPLPFLDPSPGTAPEPNPALGVRGLRAFRHRPELLDTQLDALAKAANGSGADVRVMAPMVADADDARWFVERARARGLEQAGVMVEIPSAALTADAVLGEAAFASIGTNDLTQYALAADRMVGSLAGRQDPWHPAVLALVAATADAGRRAGKPVGVCGEAAADPLLALVLVGLGVTSLSMVPAAIAGVRAALADRTLAECRKLAELARREGTAPLARAAVARVAGSLA
jgi:phosphoenolpyruvate-protein phosphotransferase (PTS system enzyme I)